MVRDRVAAVLIVLRAEGKTVVFFGPGDNKFATIFLSRSSLDEEMPYSAAASSMVGYGLASFTGLLIQLLRIALNLQMHKQCPQVVVVQFEMH